MGSDGMHPSVLRELANVIAKLHSIIFEISWRTEVPEDWRKANVTLVFKKGEKKDLESYRPDILISVPRKIREQLILNVISKHVTLIRSTQHGFTKGKLCLADLITIL